MNRIGSLPRYPGRGLLVGCDIEGLYWIYFLTGRSAASKSRKLDYREGAVGVTPVAVEAAHDGLRHYDCVRVMPSCTVVGNGSHVGKLAQALDAGERFVAAFSGVDPEPDPPIYTPRIAAAFLDDGTWLGAARRATPVERVTRSVTLARGQGWLLHTYASDSESVSISGSPYATDAPGAREALTQLWSALAPEFRVLALAGRPGSAAPIAVFTELGD